MIYVQFNMLIYMHAYYFYLKNSFLFTTYL